MLRLAMAIAWQKLEWHQRSAFQNQAKETLEYLKVVL